MKHLVEFDLEDGSTIWIEVDEPEGVGGAIRASRGIGSPEIPEKSPQTFEQALSKIRPATDKVISTLRDLVQKPDEIEMQFGFSLSAAAGVVIASASTQANYTVTLRWSSKAQQST